jgi:hypothetical protein
MKSSISRSEGFVSVGVDQDTPVFAVRSIEAMVELRLAPSAAPTREIYSSPRTPGAATATGRTCGSINCNASLTSSTCRSMSATFGPAPASGTRWSIASSRSSRSTGADAPCGPTRPSSTSLATRPTEVVSSCASDSIVGAVCRTPDSRLETPFLFRSGNTAHDGGAL